MAFENENLCIKSVDAPQLQSLVTHQQVKVAHACPFFGHVIYRLPQTRQLFGFGLKVKVK